MICILFDVDHWYPDCLDTDKYNRAYFKSIDDALMWASFYYGKVSQESEDYTRTWFIRGIFKGNTCLNYDPKYYIHTDMSWDEIDDLPLATRERYEEDYAG